MNITLSLKGFENIEPLLEPNYFIFNVSGKHYRTNKLFADFLSPKVSRFHLFDPTLKSIQISAEKPEVFLKVLQLVSKTNMNHQFKLKKKSENQIIHQKNIDDNSSCSIVDNFNAGAEENMNINNQNNNLGVTFDNDEIDSLISIAEQIENHEILAYFTGRTVDYTPDTIVSILIHKMKRKLQIDAEIHYIAKHFSEINTKQLQRIDNDTLLEILGAEDFRINSEDELFKFVYSLITKYDNNPRSYSDELNPDELYECETNIHQENNIENNQSENPLIRHIINSNSANDNNSTNYNNNRNNRTKSSPYILLDSIQIEYLSSKRLNKYLSLMNHDTLNLSIWNKICNRLLSFSPQPMLQSSRSGRKTVEIPINKEDPFEGIFQYFNHMYGGNAHSQNAIVISASSNKHCNCFDIINKGWDNRWFTNDKPLGWWKVDFKKHLVALSGYSLKTSNGADNNYPHLKSWIIEGSSDNQHWETIDIQKPNDYLKGVNYFHQFKVKPSTTSNQEQTTKPYQYIRLMSLGHDHENNHFLLLNQIEFFGTIYAFNE